VGGEVLVSWCNGHDGFHGLLRFPHHQDRHLSEPSLPPETWRAVQFSTLRVADFGDGYAVFDPRSGQTHFVDELMVLLCRDVLAKPRSFDSAAEELARLQGAEPDPQFMVGLAELMGRLEALGLVERQRA
jgi:PqqD family protein of HPr-rel-A system